MQTRYKILATSKITALIIADLLAKKTFVSAEIIHVIQQMEVDLVLIPNHLFYL